MTRLLLVVFFAILIVSQVNAQSTLALQETCAKAAKAAFDSVNKIGDEAFGRCYYSYNCHYNKKLDKCFILLQFTCAKKDESYDSVDLANVFEEKALASYSCKYGKGGVLEWRYCLLGDTHFDVVNGHEFNEQTKKWDIISDAYLNSIKNPLSDPIKKKFDSWVKPYMEE